MLTQQWNMLNIFSKRFEKRIYAKIFLIYLTLFSFYVKVYLILCPLRLGVRTRDFHSRNMGSIPVGDVLFT